jgi:uncharacterized protein YfdQ (DUF2303 family)
MPDYTNSDAQVIVDAARRGQEPIFLNNGTLAFVPQLGDGKFVSLEKFADKPARKRGTATVYDALGLNTLIAQNTDAGDITIYCHRDPENPSIIAVLNGGGAHGPGWGDARIQVVFRPTPQWVKWKSIDGKMMSQIEFAEFIEDNLEDIADPPAAEMLEVATYLQATRSADFKSGVNLSNGTVKLTNLEDITAAVAGGEKPVPASFTLGISPILGSAIFSVPARFRFRINNGKLTLGCKLQRVEDLMQQVLDDVVAKIAPREGMNIVDGLPPGTNAS